MLGRRTAALLIIHGCQALITPRLRPVVAGQRAPSLVSIKSTVADAVNKGKAEKGKVSFLKTAYPVASAATTLAWTACAMQALGTHPRLTLPPLHTRLTIAQALVPLPLLWASCDALKAAAEVGWSRLQSATYRRLNLALCASSLWLASACWFAPAFTGATTVTYACKLKAGATAIHLATAGIAAGAWFESSPGSLLQAPGRVVKGLVGSVMSLVPPGGDKLADPDAAEAKVVAPALLTAALGAWTCAALAAPFPTATLPYALGRRLSRAAGAHTLLACAAAYCARDAEVRGRSDASTFVKLRKGLRAVGVLHLLCFAAKVAFDDWSQYPAASTRPILSVASLATYAAAASL